MYPAFGVPWPRLQRAVARLTDLHASSAEANRVHALLFLCGVKYLLTYRRANGRRLSHYLDDGLREAVDHTLPALMAHCAAFKAPPPGTRLPALEANLEFQQLVFGFRGLYLHLPASTAKWLAASAPEANLVRLTFGMGVAARFAPSAHEFVRRMLDQPLVISTPVADVWESFRWHPEWSVALER
jgi:hypothetical protein